MTPIHVRYVSPRATIGSPERLLLALLEALDRDAVAPSVSFLTDGPLVARCRDELEIPTSLVPARVRRGGERRRAARTLAQLIAADGVDLVHSLTPLGHLVGGRAARLSGRPAVWSQLAAPSFRQGIEVRAALTPARGVVVPTHAIEAAQRRFNPRTVPISVVQPGTALPMEDLWGRRARGRTALGLAEADFAVGVVARLGPGQGHETVVRAGASLCRARADAKLVLVGAAFTADDRAFERELQQLVEALGLAGRVLFPGFCDVLSDCLAALDIAVYAATKSGYYPLQVVEAMAAGTALVAAATPDATEIVTEGRNAIVYPPGDDESLATCLLMLHDDPARREMLSAEGARAAAARFDAFLMARSLAELYASVAAPREASPAAAGA